MNPLENALNEYIGKDLSRFHMPGHKGAESFPEYFKYDITEVEGADSLFESSEAIFETEKRFAKIYGAGASPLHFFMCSQEHTFTNTRNHPVFRVRNI